MISKPELITSLEVYGYRLFKLSENRVYGNRLPKDLALNYHKE